MSKKEDLFNVFNFIAEYLREEDIINSDKQLLVEPKALDREINLTVDGKHIKDLMNRINSKDVQSAVTSQILNNQRKTFEKEIKRIKDEHNNKLIAEKNADEIVFLSGETETQKSSDKLLNE